MFKFRIIMAIFFSFGLIIIEALLEGNEMTQPYLNSPTNYNTGYKADPQKGDVRTSVFYVNDMHGKLTNIRHIKTAADSFSRKYQNNPEVDTFKLSGGDSNIGKPTAKNNFVISFLNSIGLEFSAIGNHEFDIGQPGFAKEIDNAKFKYVASNINVDPKLDINQDMKDQKVVKSWVVEKNGHKYGFVGATPVDLKLRLSKTSDVNGVNVDDTEKTLADIQQEVNNLRQQGINKIIMVSHLGKDKEQILAQKVSGVDVIIGGHTHDLIKGITPGDNWFKSPEGDPVLMTMAGKDGNYVGMLDLVFDDKGRIKAATNNVQESIKFPVDPFIRFMEDGYLGRTVKIGKMAADCRPKDTSLTENPIASYMADATKKKANSQLAFINSENIRGGIDGGIITERDIQELEPFRNKVYKLEISEKMVIDTLNNAAQSVTTPECKPGILQVAGLKYTITPQHTVKDVYLLNADGSQTKLDDKNPSSSKTFTAAYDDFVLKGDEFPTLKNPVKVLDTYQWTKAEAMVEQIKALNGKPLELKQDGRITVEK